jgi:BirA family transcriptional regulator, biotin operon repressor / biotin---[acetyl-CoA-carboxylase] ligase
MTPREEWRLDTHHLGRRVLVFDRLDSTSNYAALLAEDPANDGVAVLADEQTAGRGQHGRRWQCPPRSGVLLSLLLFPPPALRRPALLTAWAAVSVCETILVATGLQAKIKWPNDVLLCDRKVCGILIEQGRGLVAGIGLNLNQSEEDLQQMELPQAASLACFTGCKHDRDEVARLLLRQLDEEYERLLHGDFTTLETRWKWRVGLLGEEVQVECADCIRHGRLRELGWDGLELEQPGEALLRIPPELVRHLYGAAPPAQQFEDRG